MKNATALIERAKERGLILATAESCTGGLIAAALTDVAGSSAAFDRGFVTYSNEAKRDMLGVSTTTIAEHGAVSAETAREMAIGALANSDADAAVSVTGIAGPGGGSAEKPVGLVFIGVAKRNYTRVHKHVFRHTDGAVPNRSEVRDMTVKAALAALYDTVSEVP